MFKEKLVYVGKRLYHFVGCLAFIIIIVPLAVYAGITGRCPLTFQKEVDL